MGVGMTATFPLRGARQRTLPSAAVTPTTLSAVSCCCGQECPRAATGFQAQAQPFEVGDGLLEDVAEDIDINHRADFGVLVGVGHFAGGAVIVIAEVLEMGADLVRHLEGVQRRVGGEEAAVVGGDVQAGIAFINGAEQALEGLPYGAGVVRVVVLEGVLEGL